MRGESLIVSNSLLSSSCPMLNPSYIIYFQKCKYYFKQFLKLTCVFKWKGRGFNFYAINFFLYCPTLVMVFAIFEKHYPDWTVRIHKYIKICMLHLSPLHIQKIFSSYFRLNLPNRMI